MWTIYTTLHMHEHLQIILCVLASTATNQNIAILFQLLLLTFFPWLCYYMNNSLNSKPCFHCIQFEDRDQGFLPEAKVSEVSQAPQVLLQWRQLLILLELKVKILLHSLTVLENFSLKLGYGKIYPLGKNHHSDTTTPQNKTKKTQTLMHP